MIKWSSFLDISKVNANMIKWSSFLDISKVRARVCVCVVCVCVCPCVRVCVRACVRGSIPYAAGRKASQCISHADSKKRGFKLIDFFISSHKLCITLLVKDSQLCN